MFFLSNRKSKEKTCDEKNLDDLREDIMSIGADIQT